MQGGSRGPIPNKDDDVNDGWQPSFKKYLLKNRYTVGSLEDCYDKEDLLFFSVEFETLSVRLPTFSVRHSATPLYSHNGKVMVWQWQW